MRIMSNTSQELPCVLCGTLGNIVRESQNEELCRVKCTNPRCGHTYSKLDSLEAKSAGAVPEGPPVLDDPDPAPTTPEKEVMHVPPPLEVRPSQSTGVAGTTHVPRTPAFVFITKDRSKVEFTGKKSLKKTVLQWETAGSPFDMYELVSKKVSAKIEIQ